MGIAVRLLRQVHPLLALHAVFLHVLALCLEPGGVRTDLSKPLRKNADEHVPASSKLLTPHTEVSAGANFQDFPEAREFSFQQDFPATHRFRTMHATHSTML